MCTKSGDFVQHINYDDIFFFTKTSENWVAKVGMDYCNVYEVARLRSAGDKLSPLF